ncbi:Spc97 / Spc98 family of spindle pole body (SBP) component [Euphorbia peplus]|nr:Spc97 / Spc98 family of spindle pole body (SBP) component [Euphorbia peplus]
MAVETNFACLFDKLKVEDPCLPPSTWESIPSENGARSSSISPYFPRPTLRNLSSVSEASLVRLAFNSLQGLESALVSIQKLSAAFCTDPADRSFHGIPSLWNRSSSTQALGRILNSIGCFGSLIFLLRKFVAKFTNIRMYVDPSQHGPENSESGSQSLVNQAFAVAVGKILEGYVSALNTVYVSVRLRHSEVVNVPLHESNEAAFLTSIVHSEITLLEVYLHTKQLRTQIEALGNICNLYDIALCFAVSSLEELTAKADLAFSKFCRGGDLLTYLYTQLQVADPAHLALLKFLFVQSCEPYCGFVRSWIFRAEISDPYKEFVVECVDDLPSDLHSKAGTPFDFPLASIRDGVAVPCFLKDFLVPVIRAGQQLQVLMKLLELCDYAGPGGHTYEDVLPSCCGYLIKYMVHTSPLTFNKAHLRDLVTARKNYYSKMQEKLESLLTKLEFRYQQVALHNAAPIIFDNSRGGLESELSFPLNSPTPDKWISNVTGDKICSNSSERDGSDWFDTSDASERSSLTGSDEETEVEQSLFPSNYIEQEQQYLSSLRFSLSSTFDLEKSAQSKNSLDVESNLPDYLQKNNALDHYTSPIENKVDKDYFSRNLPCFRQRGSGKGVPDMGKDQLENAFKTSNSFTSQMGKDIYRSNFFSTNPNLTRNSSFNPMNKHVSKCSSAHGHSLSCYDFSTVENPLVVFEEKLTVSSRHDIGYRIHSTDNEQGKQVDGEDSVLVNNARSSRPCSPLDTKDQGHEAFLSTNVSGGKSWEKLLNDFHCPEKESEREHNESVPAVFEIPLDFVIDKCLLQEILLQYCYVSKLAIKLLEGFDLHEHLLALRRYHFMESADWADLFIKSLPHHKWHALEADQRVSEIQGFLERSVQRSSCEQDPNKDRLFVYMKENTRLPLSTTSIGVHSFDFLGLGYRVDWPVSIVLTPSSLKIYADIFSFLVQVKLAVYSLNDVWCSLKDVIYTIGKNSRSAEHKKEVNQFNMLIKMRHQVNHFISTLQQFVLSQLSHISWCRFQNNLKHKVKDMMDLESVHMEYLTESLRICFLSDETRTIAGIIERILQCALDFRSCITSNVGDVVLNEGDFLGKLSRINMSQVFAIRQKFNKNLKELHQCYLRSPKHGEFGLSSFWGYLNYNQYFTDA